MHTDCFSVRAWVNRYGWTPPCRVYALDCLGFGWSSKPLVDYKGYNLWEDQIAGQSVRLWC